MGSGIRLISIISAAILVISVSGFSPVNPAPGARSEQRATIDPAVAGRWHELLQRTPFPYLKPLPAGSPTPVDGTYVKFDPKPQPHVPCRRCPDYVPEGGVWKLQLDRGVMRIFYGETGWRSLASFEVEGDRLMLFNDPHCTGTIGIYHWKLHRGQLGLELIDDPCAINMRARNLTRQPWRSCQPPDAEAAVSGHWPVPAGCE